jgi:hypothetical protein
MRNPHSTVESNFQLRFSVNVWCAVLDNQLIHPSILDGRLTGEAYLWSLQEELLWLLENVPLNKRGLMYFQHAELLLIFHVKLELFWTVVSLGNGWAVAVPTIGQPGLQTSAHWIILSFFISSFIHPIHSIWGWMKELVYGVKVGMWDALLGCILDTADRIRNSGSCNEQLTQFTTER